LHVYDLFMENGSDALDWDLLPKSARIQRFRHFAEDARNQWRNAAPPQWDGYANLARHWDLLAEAMEREAEGGHSRPATWIMNTKSTGDTL
jgi:hypothetical protein